MGTISEFFGYAALDDSSEALKVAAKYRCPFLSGPCEKVLGHGGESVVSGACAVRQNSSDSPDVIICPIRLYADNYRILRIISERTFHQELRLYSGRVAVARAKEEGGAVAVFGHRWGGELRLPKRSGSGNYFADWVLARLDGEGELQEFTSIEVQSIDTTGNYRDSRDFLIKNRSIFKSTVGLNWENVSKRIIPQLVYKGQVLQREQLCKSGLWFVCPSPVYDRILQRLGGKKNLPFGYSAQPGALHFLVYDYDQTVEREKGKIRPLAVIDDQCTTVEKLQQAFSNIDLPAPNAYGDALRRALYE